MNKNYIPEIANMLKVEIGEEFSISGSRDLYRFSETALEFRGIPGTAGGLFWNEVESMTLQEVLLGERKIIRKPWKPLNGQEWWYVGADGLIGIGHLLNGSLRHMLIRLGNCYRTKEDAEANMEKWSWFYSFKCDDAAYAFSEANLLITHTVKNHPIDFNRYDYVTKEIIGRHIWYRNKPYTFCTYYEDRCCARAIPGHLDIVAETKSDHIPGEVTIDLLYPYDVRWFCMDY